MESLRTPASVARLLIRGIRSNFKPEYQEKERQNLVEYFSDLSASRYQFANAPDQPDAAVGTDTHEAAEDAEWLGAISAALERDTTFRRS